MFGFFKRRSLLDDATKLWIFEAYAWALRNFGSDSFYEATTLITPTSKHFPGRFDDAEIMAQKTFERVKTYAGMQNWACELDAQDADANPVIAPTILIHGAPRGPAGTFVVEPGSPNGVKITYNPDQLRDPEGLIATFAHELAHYLGGTAHEQPPGGEEYWEHATDLLGVFMGFGLFLANSAVSFRQFSAVDSQGWSIQTQGYMTEDELTYALAIFCALKSIPRADAEVHLKRSLRPFFRKAMKECESSNDLVRLRAIDETCRVRLD